MMKRRKGRIFNISSVAATHVNPGQTNYAGQQEGAINSFTVCRACRGTRQPWRNG